MLPLYVSFTSFIALEAPNMSFLIDSIWAKGKIMCIRFLAEPSQQTVCCAEGAGISPLFPALVET